MSTCMQPMMTNPQPRPVTASALRAPATGRLRDPRKVLVAVLGAMSIAFGAALFATESHVGATDQNASPVGIGSVGAYARVLEPGSRGNVVDV